jgi:hypothetical protein
MRALTKACDVENPTPPRLTPVIKIVLLRIPSGKALATSRPSVSLLNSGCDVVIMKRYWEYERENTDTIVCKVDNHIIVYLE